MQNRRLRMEMMVGWGAVACWLFIPACAEQQLSNPAPVTPIVREVSSPATPKPPETVDVVLNRVCESPPKMTCPLKIVGVRVASSETTVTLRFETNRPGLAARIWPPGHPSAFHLRSTDGRERQLLRIEGVPVGPAVVVVAPGISTEFKLVFEPLPAETKAFDLLEGESEAGLPTRSFRFVDVRLDGPADLPNKAMDPTGARVGPLATSALCSVGCAPAAHRQRVMQTE